MARLHHLTRQPRKRHNIRGRQVGFALELQDRLAHTRVGARELRDFLAGGVVDDPVR
ncbi:hypothetical protein [Corynebacterium riegelii]|uniref:hypothetical protein n=1 Tax=Corynebacterium riegelii TaxID=156976 RepID=UPI0035CF1EF9